MIKLIFNKYRDLIKNNLRVFSVIFVFTLLIHVLMYLKVGAKASTDYRIVYLPEARQILALLHGGAWPVVSFYQLSHFGYAIIIAFIENLFGPNSLRPLIIMQCVFSIISFIMIFLIALQYYQNRKVVCFFSIITLLFFDNLVFVYHAVPDSVFRFLFIFTYLIALEYYVRSSYKVFTIILLGSTIVLSLLRIETSLLLLPLYWLMFRRAGPWIRKRKMIFLLSLVLLLLAAVALAPRLLKIEEAFYLDGHVVLGTDYYVRGITQIEPFDPGNSHNILYAVTRQLKLYGLRFWQILNPFPPFWSKSHRIVYGSSTIILYLLIIPAMIRMMKEKNEQLQTIFYIFLCSLVVHLLTFVDAAKRQTMSILPFFILFAGYGFDYMVTTYQAHKARLTDNMSNKG